MSFVERLDDYTPPLPTPDPGTETPIPGDWWPQVDPAQVRAEHRIREAVSPARLRAALLAAVVTVGNDCAAWQAARAAEGYGSLGDVPAAPLDGASRLLFLYRRAVALFAKAEIVERYRDIDIGSAGERRAEDLDPAPAELRRDALHAVRDLLGKGRTTVELI